VNEKREMMRRLIGISILILLLSACAIHTGNTSSNAAVTDENFRIMDLVYGQAQTTQVFGFGGLKPDALVLDAKREMYRNHPLEAGQMFANITVDYKRSFYLIVVTTMVTVSADVIQFNPTEEQKKEDVFSNQIEQDFPSRPTQLSSSSALDYLKIGSKVGIYTNGEMRTMELSEQLGKKRFQVMASDSSTFIYDIKSIYLIEKEEYPFEHKLLVGDRVNWLVGSIPKSGMIVGVNGKMVITKNGDEYQSHSPADLKPIKPE
jgi:hypothetical protein